MHAKQVDEIWMKYTQGWQFSSQEDQHAIHAVQEKVLFISQLVYT
jgi:hypothetical protein